MTDGAVCNITSKGRTRRGATGVVVLVGVATAVAMLDARFDTRWWRLGVVPFLCFAFLCGIQAAEST